MVAHLVQVASAKEQLTAVFWGILWQMLRGFLGGGRGAVDLGKLEHGDGRFKEFQYGNDSAVGNNKLLVNWKTTFLKREK